MKTLLVGNGGRESSLAWRLAEQSAVHVVMKHRNPTLMEICERSGGGFLIGDFTDPRLVAGYASSHAIDLALVSNDDALAAGVVDHLLAAGIRTVGPTRAGAEIEWNKAYARRLLAELLPEVTPRFWSCAASGEIAAAVRRMEEEGMAAVVKPQGLTGGKGVKVMGEHLNGFGEVREYAEAILREGIGQSREVVLEERLEGVEFTVQAITDGERVVAVPATYDYPYRFAGDRGPGTGGMGSLMDGSGLLPFLDAPSYDAALAVVRRVLRALEEQGRRFNGVLNAGFFLTPAGLRVMEFNARFGDPECMNVMCLLATPLLSVLEDVERGALDETAVRFARQASVVKYLVAPEYCRLPPVPHRFAIDVRAIEESGGHVFFAAAEARDGELTTVGASRCVAIAAEAPSLPAAAERVNSWVDEHVEGPLELRRDIGTASEVERLAAWRRSHAVAGA